MKTQTKTAATASKMAALRALTPSSEVTIKTAKLFAYMALRDSIWPQWKTIITAICEAGNFMFCDREHMIKLGYVGRFEVSFSDKYFSDNTYLMKGVDLYGKEGYEGSDADVFNQTQIHACEGAGFIHGANTMAIIDTKIRDLRRDILTDMMPITEIDPTEVYCENYDNLLELTLNLLGQIVAKMSRAERDEISKAIYNEYVKA